jgi:hypothetical protein
MATTLRCSSMGPPPPLVEACTISSRAKIGCAPSPNNVLKYVFKMGMTTSQPKLP